MESVTKGKGVSGDDWVAVEVESNKWYATERLACDRQDKTNKQTNKQSNNQTTIKGNH